MTPMDSWPEPGRKPGVSTSATNARPKALQLRSEARALVGGLGVDDAAEVARLVGDDADGAGLDAREGGDQVARPVRGGLEQRASVHDPVDGLASVVGRTAVEWHDAARVGARGVGGRRVRWCLPGIGRQVGEQLPYEEDRADVGVDGEVASAVASTLRPCTVGPPSSRAEMSSPVTSRTTAGPARNMLATSVMTTKSVRAGE